MSKEEERRQAGEKGLLLGRGEVTLHVVERTACSRDDHIVCACEFELLKIR